LEVLDEDGHLSNGECEVIDPDTCPKGLSSRQPSVRESQ
jgi:hypothetical protein